MGKIDLIKHEKLLKEARALLKRADLQAIDSDTRKGIDILTEEDLFEWLQVFEADRIKLDGCNNATILR